MLGVGDAKTIVVVLIACPVVGLKFKYFWFCDDANCVPKGVAADSHVEAPLGTLGLKLFVVIDAEGNPAAPGNVRLVVHDGFAPVGVVNAAYAAPGVTTASACSPPTSTTEPTSERAAATRTVICRIEDQVERELSEYIPLVQHI